jgi:hypothetical protein
MTRKGAGMRPLCSYDEFPETNARPVPGPTERRSLIADSQSFVNSAS